MKWMLWCAALALALPGLVWAGDVRKISSGQKVDLRKHLKKGKYTVFEFYANW